MIDNIKKIKCIAVHNRPIFFNLSYISLLQLLLIISPLITYPYLIRTIGTNLYGWVILAQVISSYCSIFVDFGFNFVSAKYISVYRDNIHKLSEVLSSILTIKIVLWLISLFIYIFVISVIKEYNKHFFLFFFSFGITFNELLFPQYYFQGIEKMKFITIINIVIRSISILLIFLFVKTPNNYILVPLFTSFGFIVGGIISLYIIFIKHKIRYYIPKYNILKFYFKDASILFITNIITTIKDKLNYILLSNVVPINQIVIYDLGSKMTAILSKPSEILSTVLLPKVVKDRNLKIVKYSIALLAIIILILVLLLNYFLYDIVRFFVAENIELLPLRIFSLAPLFLGISIFLASNLMIAFGYTKYLIYSISFTTIIYLIMLAVMYLNGYLNSILSFVLITLFSYFGEFLFRIILSFNIIKILKNKY